MSIIDPETNPTNKTTKKVNSCITRLNKEKQKGVKMRTCINWVHRKNAEL